MDLAESEHGDLDDDASCELVVDDVKPRDPDVDRDPDVEGVNVFGPLPVACPSPLLLLPPTEAALSPVEVSEPERQSPRSKSRHQTATTSHLAVSEAATMMNDRNLGKGERRNRRGEGGGGVVVRFVICRQ